MIRIITLTALSFAMTGFAADNPDDRSKLVGTWQLEDSSMKEAGVWTIEEKNDKLRIKHATGDQKADEFECNTMGRECKAEEAGKPVTISMWYSGPKLVELETRGSNVIKRRFSPKDADTLELEVIPVVPEGKSQVVSLRRVHQTETAHQ